MVRTTLNIDDDLYKALVKESLEKYGTTRHLSKVVNMKLRMVENLKIGKKRIELPRIKLGRKIDWKYVEKIVEGMEVSWKE